MELSINTPALIFPTVCLLLLAYTNRFVAIGARIRNLHLQYKEEKSDELIQQIRILRTRVHLVRDCQITGITSLFFSAFTMFLIYYGFQEYSHMAFGLSLILLLGSFFLSAVEIFLSTKALNIQLREIEKELK